MIMCNRGVCVEEAVCGGGGGTIWGTYIADAVVISTSTFNCVINLDI